MNKTDYLATVDINVFEIKDLMASGFVVFIVSILNLFFSDFDIRELVAFFFVGWAAILWRKILAFDIVLVDVTENNER